MSGLNLDGFVALAYDVRMKKWLAALARAFPVARYPRTKQAIAVRFCVRY